MNSAIMLINPIVMAHHKIHNRLRQTKVSITFFILGGLLGVSLALLVT